MSLISFLKVNQIFNLDEKGEAVYDPLVFKGDFYRTIDEGTE